MTDSDLENIRAIVRAEVADVRTGLADVRTDVADLRAEVADVRTGLADVRVGLAEMRADVRALRDEVRPMRAHLDGMPMLQRNLTITQQEVRALKAAFNDFALTNPTTGKIEVLHHDVNRVQAENAELTVKVATLERLVRELQESR